MREVLDKMVMVIGAALFLCGIAFLFMHPWIFLAFLVTVILTAIALIVLKWIKGWFVDTNFGAKERRKKQIMDIDSRRLHGIRTEDEDL